jgi:hypothetical protein
LFGEFDDMPIKQFKKNLVSDYQSLIDELYQEWAAPTPTPLSPFSSKKVSVETT